MSTISLPLDEFRLLRKVCKMIRGSDEPRWPTPDEMRDFLAENAFIVKPGETLVLKLSHDLSPENYRDIVMMLNECTASGYIPFRVLCVPMTDEVAVVSDEHLADAVRAVLEDMEAPRLELNQQIKWTPEVLDNLERALEMHRRRNPRYPSQVR